MLGINIDGRDSSMIYFGSATNMIFRFKCSSKVTHCPILLQKTWCLFNFVIIRCFALSLKSLNISFLLTWIQMSFLRLSVDGLKEPFSESLQLLNSLLAFILQSTVLFRQFLHSDFEASSSSCFAHDAVGKLRNLALEFRESCCWGVAIGPVSAIGAAATTSTTRI